MVVGQVYLRYVAWNVDNSLTDEEINQLCDEMIVYLKIEFQEALAEEKQEWE